MIVAGAYIAAERGKAVPRSFLIALVSVLVSYGICIAVFIATGSLEVAPNIIIPISGMLIGNAVNSVSLVYHRSAKDFEENQSMIEAMLIDGADRKTSLLIPKRETLKNAMVPKIDSLKTLGIVHIPGAMAGMMVAGADPLQAAGYQILLFFGIVGIGGLSSIFSGEMSYKALFAKHYPHLKTDKTSDKKNGRKK
jgi:putative ABC transport system permease protein